MFSCPRSLLLLGCEWHRIDATWCSMRIALRTPRRACRDPGPWSEARTARFRDQHPRKRNRSRDDTMPCYPSPPMSDRNRNTLRTSRKIDAGCVSVAVEAIVIVAPFGLSGGVLTGPQRRLPRRFRRRRDERLLRGRTDRHHQRRPLKAQTGFRLQRAPFEPTLHRFVWGSCRPRPSDYAARRPSSYWTALRSL
jgi:hypothetical protein